MMLPPRLPATDGGALLLPPYPYHSKYGANSHPFVKGGLDVLDRAFKWATVPLTVSVTARLNTVFGT